MESTVPLYCRIPTDENQYLYDAATNRLFRVSKYVYDHVEDLSRMSKDEVACEASKRSIQDAEHLRSSHTALQEQRARYNLLPTVHPRIGLQLSASQIETSIMGRCHNFILEVTEKCNLRCRYCIYSGSYPNNRSHGSASMDSRTAGQAVDLAHRHVNALPAETPVGIGFTGGEPLLNWPLITDAADYARRKSWGGRTVMLNLTSNATLLKKEHLDFFIDHAFNLTVSLDGPRGVHDRGRVFADGNRGTYRKVRRAVDMIRERDPGYFDQRVMFSAVLSYPIDWTVLDEFFRVELDLPPGKVLFSNIRRGSKAGFDLPSGTEIEIGHEEIEKRFMEAAQQGVLFGDFEPGSRQAKLQSEGKSCLTFPIQIGPMIRFHERPLFSGWPKGPLQPYGACLLPTRRLLVNVRGDLYGCDRLDFNDFTKIGHVATGIDLKKIKRMLREYYDLTKEECSRCWAVRLCGLCFANCVGTDAFDRGTKLRQCAGMRAGLKKRLQTYCRILERNPDALAHHGEVTFQ